jgi:HAD superfamily hydrolase (TIGR01549 family)
LPYPDAVEVLTRLHAEGLQLGVISNIGWDVRPAFEKIRVPELVHSFTLSCERGSVKPETALFQVACAELAVPPEWMLFVGDDPMKDGAEAQLGMPVYLPPGPRSPDRPRGLAAALALATS